MQGFFTGNKLGMTPAGGFWSGGLILSGMEPGSFDTQFWSGGLILSGMEPGSFDTQFWPKWESQRHQLGVGASWILDGGPYVDQAWDFMKWNTRRDVMELVGFFKEWTRTTPVRRSMNNEERYGKTGMKNWHVFYDTVDERPDTGPIPAPVFSVELTNIYTRYTSLATSGEQTAQEALDNMQRELEDLYARNA